MQGVRTLFSESAAFRKVNVAYAQPFATYPSLNVAYT